MEKGWRVRNGDKGMVGRKKEQNVKRGMSENIGEKYKKK